MRRGRFDDFNIHNIFPTELVRQNCDLLAVNMQDGFYQVYKSRKAEVGSIISKGLFDELKMEAESPIVLDVSYMDMEVFKEGY